MMGLKNVRDYNVQIWLINNRNETLLFKKKDTYGKPEYWSCVEDITGENESGVEAAIRIAEEKTGIALKTSDLYRLKVNFNEENISENIVFVCRKEISIHELILCEEYEEAAVVSKAEFKNLSDEEKIAHDMKNFYHIYQENVDLGIIDKQNKVFIDETEQILKGNLHTHSIYSDGRYDVAELVQIYKKKNYDFLAISDHDVYYKGNVDNKIDSDVVLLHGIEATCTYTGNNPAMGDYSHFTCLEQKEMNGEPYEEGFYQNCEGVQNYIDKLSKTYQLVQFNHPLFTKMSDSDFVNLGGYQLFEIYNHKDFRWETGVESAEWLCRVLLNHGKRLFVTAGDDFHGPYKDVKFDECFGGYVMVQAQKNAEDILNALQHGKFYASTGPQIFHYSIEGQNIKIKTSDAKRIIFYSNLRRCKNVYHEDNSVFNEAEYELSGEEKYIWIKIVDSEGNSAWTQPFFIPYNE